MLLVRDGDGQGRRLVGAAVRDRIGTGDASAAGCHRQRAYRR
jgi:hypothetical protein